MRAEDVNTSKARVLVSVQSVVAGDCPRRGAAQDKVPAPEGQDEYFPICRPQAPRPGAPGPECYML